MQNKIQLFSEGHVRRPSYEGDDLIEKIIDQQSLSLATKNLPKQINNKYTDIEFIDHESVILLDEKGVLSEYKKSGRNVVKHQVPFLVSKARPCKQSAEKAYFVISKYYSIYKKHVLSQEKQTSNNYYGLATNALTDIIERSKDLEDLMKSRKELSDTLEQLQLCVNHHSLEFGADCHTNDEGIIILTIHHNCEINLIGKYWSLHVQF